MGRRTTIIDVAKECGLSQATVARVLNGQKDIQVKEKTRERVLKAAQKVGYRRNALAANFRRQQTNTIAISIADAISSAICHGPTLSLIYFELSSFFKLILK